MDIITNKCSVIKISYGVLVNGPNRNENIAKIHNFWPILACLTILEIVFWQKKSPCNIWDPYLVKKLRLSQISALSNFSLISWLKKCKFLKLFFFCFFIIKSIRMKSGQHILPIWKGLSVLNTHILIWDEYLWNWGCNAKEYECNFFLIRLYVPFSNFCHS